MDTFAQLLEYMQGGSVGWVALAAVALAVVVASWADRRSARKRRVERLEAARQEYKSALESAPPGKIVAARKRYEAAKKALCAAVALSATLCGGCRTNGPLVLNEFVLSPSPGEVVPDLPDGEARWLLMSVPTGAELVLGESLR